MGVDTSSGTSPVPETGGSGQVEENNAPGAPGGSSASGSSGSGEIAGNTVVKDLNALKEIAPDVYKKMMEGIASQIVNEMKHHQERLKKLMREAQNK